MGFFTRKKDLERARIENERLQHELAERTRRDEERIAEERKKQLLEDRAIQDAKDKRNAKLKKMMEASPETLRDLRELIRNRYQMDNEIWGLRSARKPDRPKVLEKMVKADAIMEEILTTINTWENQKDGNWTDEEWDRVQEIKERLQSDGKRVWKDSPPWTDAGNAGKGRVGAGRADRW
jgi:hypothetical protein